MDEPDGEVVDAFAIRSWNQSKCKRGCFHRKTAFVFPPIGQEWAVMKRARSDGVKGVLVVPTELGTQSKGTGWRCGTTQSPWQS
jgi:hypothetical protein